MLLREKILAFLEAGEDGLGRGCFDSALALQASYGGRGSVYYVGDAGIHAGLEHALVCHYYFLPPESLDSDPALNQADSGYPEFPALTVGEVKQIGVSEES